MDNSSIIRHRTEKADETFAEALLMFENNHYRGVANRLYYSAFYVVNALLIATDIIAKTHSGVKNLFFKEYVVTGVFSKDLATHYQTLFNLRTEGDYSDFSQILKEQVEPLIKITGDFIEQIKAYINTHFLNQ
jgi:uncharacterized protein (UPF0332 family)